MKVVFNYDFVGNRLTMNCSELPLISGSNAVNNMVYFECFKAIKRQVDELVDIHSKSLLK